jgi:hypothetical protein
MIDFKEVSTLGRGNHVKVRRTMVSPETRQPVLATIGWIAERNSGGFAYFEPESNELNPRFIEDDLATLKQAIERAYHE